MLSNLTKLWSNKDDGDTRRVISTPGSTANTHKRESKQNLHQDKILSY